jgi:hypothetical protein
MHDKLAALVALGKHLGMFDQRTQKTNVVYAGGPVKVRARVDEILAAGAERAEITVEQVLRELGKLGFSCIGAFPRSSHRTGSKVRHPIVLAISVNWPTHARACVLFS